MKELKERLKVIEEHVRDKRIVIMIIGLGSVGTYLLDYIVSRNDETISVVVVGRNREKMDKKVNIVQVSALIRGLNKTNIEIESGIDISDVGAVQATISKYKPDFIVNSSRAYSGLKYGSISWQNIRAYGIWTPLSIRFTKNIMEACDKANTDAVVINTSYSDAVIPWLKSAGRAYPDFGSGNMNHLIPRIKLAVAKILGINDFWNVDVMFAAGHFHDVCISKEGHCEGVNLPLKVYYRGEAKDLDKIDIYRNCCIAMPVDAQRNMMNASSNYQIIDAVISAIRTQKNQRVFSPGVFGEIGGYPVLLGYNDGSLDAWIDETIYSYDVMNKANRESMYLDGIEDVEDGCLFYTDELLEKVRNAFGVDIPKKVAFDDIETVAQYIIDRIIVPQTTKETI